MHNGLINSVADKCIDTKWFNQLDTAQKESSFTKRYIFVKHNIVDICVKAMQTYCIP